LCSVRLVRGVLRGQGFEWPDNRFCSDRSSHSQGLHPPCMPCFSSRSSFPHCPLSQLDSAAQFNRASRPDLAGKEQQEADLLAKFLPPLLPETEIDGILQEVIAEQVSKGQGNQRKYIGQVFKAFYSRVDRAAVDPDLVKRRAEALLSA
jgi:Yqey-like protein